MSDSHASTRRHSGPAGTNENIRSHIVRFFCNLPSSEEARTTGDKCFSPAHLSQQIIERCVGRARYTPSKLLDWEAGRELEVEAIWGEPLRLARAAGAETPRREIVYTLLKALATTAKRR
ncbi:MAG TPA: ketopantoate reductase C-terminal domain-containing protein [Chthoniobacterales bacterium]|nr:ketopantoate reductase C-terminal domain-containing protein [Chthoniobacterales bacterium]